MLPIRRPYPYRILRRYVQSAAAERKLDVANPTSRRSARASPPKATSSGVPIRHSRKKLPPVCTDQIQLQALTQEVFEAPLGSLFRYEGKNESAAAWQHADTTVQKVEYLLRGHAFSLTGTQWSRWITSVENKSENPDETLTTMEALLDRMWEEGHTYMTLRSSRMEELYGAKEGNHEQLSSADDGIQVHRLSPGEDLEDDMEDDNDEEEDDHETEVFDTIEDLQDDIARFAQEEGLTYDPTPDDAFLAGADDSDTETGDLSYMNDFAFPGPTVAMYDTFLDAMACETSSELSTPRTATLVLEDILLRHDLDGGDTKNSNVHTLPTVLSINAAIRVASSQPYDKSSKHASNLQLRDESLGLAFTSFDLLGRSSVVDRNSATYKYLMQLIENFFPASRIRGNIACGMFQHAVQQGLIDDSVVASFLAANIPSNGQEFEEWIDRHGLRDKTTELPSRWKYLSRSRRYHPRESTY